MKQRMTTLTLLLLAVSLWIAIPYDLGPINLQLFEALSLFVIVYTLYDYVTNMNTNRLRISHYEDWLLILGIVLIIFAGLLSLIHAISKVNVVKYEFKYLLGALIVVVIVYNIKTLNEAVLIKKTLLAASLIVILISILGLFIPSIGDITNGSRVRGFLLNPNQFGILLSAILPLAIVDVWTFNKLKNYILLFFLLVGIIITGSKANIIISIGSIVLLVIVFTYLENKISFKKIMKYILVYASSYGIGILLIYYRFPNVIEKTTNVIKEPATSETVLTRLGMWKKAVSLFREYPFTGIGGNNLSHYIPYDHAHNIVFDIISSTGIVGFLGFAALSFGILFLAIKSIKYVKENKSTINEYTSMYMALALGTINYFISNQFSDSFGSTTLTILMILLGMLISVRNILEKQTDYKETNETKN